MGIGLGTDNWEVCAHTHTPGGTKPDIDSISHWNWSPAQIPFDAINWLFNRGDGPDPMVDRNDLHYRWVEDVDWALRKTFTLPHGAVTPDDELQLVLDGIDCYCEVYLNGVHLGRTLNQFREHVFDLDDLRTDQPNELLFYISSAKLVNTVLESAYGQLPAGFDTGRVHARRCQSVTGWDWTPRLSSVAVLAEPRIRINNPISVTNPHVYVTQLPAVTSGQATLPEVQLHLEIDLASRRRAAGELIWEIYDCDTGELVAEKTDSVNIKAKTVRSRHTISVADLKLWWPASLGAQARYKAAVRLECTDRVGASYLSEAECVFGVRTVTIDRRKDDAGETFIPTVNGVPVFCRGANWVPVNILPSRATEADYRQIIAAALGAGINCLRVWGGGIYEHEIFYELCDRAGILVWQDFMFACAAYPIYREFLDEVEAEAIYQVQRLRNHPCLMIWCGNSENEWLHQAGNLKKGNEQRVIGENIWSHLLREVVEDNDPTRVYHQSSPFGKNRLDYNDAATGDRHSWQVWADWQPADDYLLDSGRFISEFGLQSLPCPETLAEFTPAARDLYDLNLAHHQRMPEGTERLVKYVAAHFKIPADLPAWIGTSQAMQAMLLARAVENWRRRRFHTAGCVIWQLNDAYPAISWSLLDYARRPKAAFWEARRFFAPVLLSAEILVGETPTGAVQPEHWQQENPSAPEGLVVEAENAIWCTPVVESVQCRFYLTNETSLTLAGTLSGCFMQGDAEVEALPTIQLKIEPNGSQTALTHVLDSEMLKILPEIQVRAEFILDEESRQQLDDLATACAAVQQDIAGDQPSLVPVDLNAGLKLSRILVDPRLAR